MAAPNGLIATRADVERIERTPLAAQYAADSTYDLLRRSTACYGERDAPATAVGKIFKPELRWRAIEHVLTEALAQRSIAATVTAGGDDRHGTLARVQLADAARIEEAREVLGAFAVVTEVS